MLKKSLMLGFVALFACSTGFADETIEETQIQEEQTLVKGCSWCGTKTPGQETTSEEDSSLAKCKKRRNQQTNWCKQCGCSDTEENIEEDQEATV